MLLRDQVNADIATAMKAKEATRLSALRMLKAAILNKGIEKGHDLDDADFLAWLAASDVVVDLRHPHRGEVSGSLARAMQAGRPTIVSGVDGWRLLKTTRSGYEGFLHDRFTRLPDTR